MLKFVLATHNKNKVKEMESILGRMLSGISDSSDVEFCVLTAEDVGMTDEIEENGSTFEENARIKASALAAPDRFAVADDSGLEVDALGGAPGVYSARYSGGGDSANNEKLLSELKEVSPEKRTARFVSVICCIMPDGREILCRGECEGLIFDSPRGKGGFGYDPLFYYAPLEKTFAELTADEKNSISHRAIALEKFSSVFASELEAGRICGK